VYRGIRQTPGPAAYNTRRASSAGPKYSMKARREDTKVSSTPAPDHYRPKSAPGAKGTTWGADLVGPQVRRRPRSAVGAGCGPSPGLAHRDIGGKGSPNYSIRARREPRPPSRERRLPHNYTHFGY